MTFKMETFRAFIPEYRRIQRPEKPEATQISTSIQSQNNINKLKDEFATIKKNRGLFEKTYDFCKNLTSFGTGYKKIEKNINLTEKKELKAEELEKSINKYKVSCENAKENCGNVISILASGGTFLGLEKLKTFATGHLSVNQSFRDKIDNNILKLNKNIKNVKFLKKINLPDTKFLYSSPKTKALFAISAALVGGFTKYFVMKFDRLGSKKYSIENKKELSKDELKAKKKEIRKMKRKESFKNFSSGMFDGITAPILALGGGLIGVPAYIATNLGIKQIFKKDKEKSFAEFSNKIKDNAVLNTIALAAVSIPMLKSTRFLKVLQNNMDVVVEKLNSSTFKNIHSDAGTILDKLKNILFENEKISKILNSYDISLENKISQLTDANIFAVKFKQIESDELANVLQNDCPVTRTLEEATEFIHNALGNKDYTVIKNLGTGTVAETYLATTKDGKEVAIKILKKGISKEKILKDKEEFMQLITKGLPEEQLSGEQIILKRNLDDMSEKIIKEADLLNEANAAKELAKYTTKANVVVPIEAKEGVYVMEKAPGISVKNLREYISAQDMIKRDIDKEKYQKVIDDIKAKSPTFKDFDLTADDVKKLLYQYVDIQTEQFVKLNKNGKVIHGDIHPGNIFFDIDSLRKKNGKAFTLIDTGNVIELTKQQTKDALRFTTYIKQGNYKDIAKAVTDGAALPEGITKEEAIKYVENELKKYFTDYEHKLEKMTIDTLTKLTDKILNEKGIIPNNIQATLNKSKKAAKNSLQDLAKSLFDLKFNNLDADKKTDIAKGMAILSKELAQFTAKYLSSNKLQETKNLSQLSLSEIINYFRNPNKLQANSEEYLTYILKQFKTSGDDSIFNI